MQQNKPQTRPKNAYAVSNIVFPGAPTTGNNKQPLCPQTSPVKHTLDFTSKASAFTKGKTDANYNNPIDIKGLSSSSSRLPSVTHSHIFPPPAHKAAAGHHKTFAEESKMVVVR